MTQRTALYARVSTTRQQEERTVASQLAALEKAAEGMGLVVAAEHRYVDEGYSGSRLDRPGLDALRVSLAGGTGHIAGSYHDSGNGLDCWAGGNTPTPSEKAAGDAAVNWLVANADALKVQEVIWYGRIWLWRSQSAGWQTYTGSNPHRDHIHVSVARPGDGR